MPLDYEESEDGRPVHVYEAKERSVAATSTAFGSTADSTTLSSSYPRVQYQSFIYFGVS